MIPSKDFEDQKLVYSYQGKGFWRITEYFSGPSITMENIDTGERKRFGIGGHTEKDFLKDDHFAWDPDSWDITPYSSYGVKIYAERLKEKCKVRKPKEVYDETKERLKLDVLRAIQRFQEQSGCYITSINISGLICKSRQLGSDIISGIANKNINIETTIDKPQESIDGEAE